MLTKRLIKPIIVLVIGLYFLQYGLTAGSGHWLDNVSLVIHEAGHVFFMPFGQTLGVLGGSLMQLIVPTIFIIYFLYRRDYFAAGIVMFWLAQNFWNVAVYAGDAAAMKLPLLGGDGTIHDWNYLLTRFGLLRQVSAVAGIIAGGGWLTYLGGLFVSFRTSLQEPVFEGLIEE